MLHILKNGGNITTTMTNVEKITNIAYNNQKKDGE